MAIARVVITGIGAVSPFGVGTHRLMEALYAGRSAVTNEREHWHDYIKDLSSWVGAPLSEPIDFKQIPRKLRRFMGRIAIMAYLAASEALDRVQIPREALESNRTGVSFASTMGSVNALDQFFNTCFEKAQIDGLPAGIFFQCMSHTCAANLAHALGITGRVVSPNAACASSLRLSVWGWRRSKPDGRISCFAVGPRNCT